MARCLVGMLCLFCLGGCRLGVRQEENVYKDLIKGFDELAGILTRVINETSAADARERVKKLAPRLQELKQRKDQNDRFVPDEKVTEIRKKYEPQLAGVITRAANQNQRIRRGVPGGKTLSDEVQALFQSMNIVAQ